jgi:GntR family transcriptional regulator
VQTSLYEHLGVLGRAPVRALQYLRALNADARHAELLGVPPGQALLHITRVGYLDSGQPIELTQSFCRSDVYGFVTEMRREP